MEPLASSPESGSHWALMTPKSKVVEEAEASSPRTPEMKVGAADRLVVRSESRLKSSPKAVDLLMSNILEKRRANANFSPLRDCSLDSELFPTSQLDRQLHMAETKAGECTAAVTVKLLRLLTDISIAPRELEKTMFSLLTLCAEVDPTVEVGSNCKVMISRVWPTVKRYMQSQGQVVQAVRKLIPSVKRGKVRNGAIARAGEMVTGVSEIRLREEKGGNVGVVVLKLVKSVVEFAKVWEKLPEKGKKEKIKGELRQSTSRASFTPQTSIFHPEDPKPRQLIHPDIPPSPIPICFFDPSESPPTKMTPLSPDSLPLFQQLKSDLQSKRRQTLLQTTLNWELEFLLRKLIMAKISTKEGSSEVIERSHLVSEFKSVISMNASIRGSLDGPDGEWSSQVVGEFVMAVEEGNLYDLEVQRAVKMMRLESRMEEVGRTYQMLAKEKERLEGVVNLVKDPKIEE